MVLFAVCRCALVVVDVGVLMSHSIYPCPRKWSYILPSGVKRQFPTWIVAFIHENHLKNSSTAWFIFARFAKSS